jgi:hypothetical protein
MATLATSGLLSTQSGISTLLSNSRSTTASKTAQNASSDDVLGAIGDILDIGGSQPTDSSTNADEEDLYSQLRNSLVKSASSDKSSTMGNFLNGLFSTQSTDEDTNSLLQSIQDKFENLTSLDPEEAEKLSLLLKVIAALNPDSADSILQTIDSALGNILGMLGGTQTSATSEIPAGTSSGDASSTGETTTTTATVQSFSFTLDFEIEMSESASMQLSTLTDNGVSVETAQISSSQRFSVHIEYNSTQVTLTQQSQLCDPLVLDLGGNGIDLTSATDGANFDIDGDGTVDRTAFVQGDDALLALDRNGNGIIDDGTELFGNQNGAANGFAELATYDDNGDGAIDEKDAIYSSLRLLHDMNGDGSVAMNELSTLSEMKIDSLNLRYYSGQTDTDSHGNLLAERSSFTRKDGSAGSMTDGWLVYA